MTATDWPLRIADRSEPPHTHRLHALIADDHRSTSFTVWETLSGQADVGTISTAESFDAALAMTGSELPDVCLVSAEFGAGEGLRLTYRLKRLQRPRPVLVYAAPVHSRLAGAAMIADADGIFDPNADASVLADLIRRVTTGAQAFPRLVPNPFTELAARVAEADRRIVAMLLEGDHPDDIAAWLGISASAFRLRREVIVRCLDGNVRIGAAAAASS
jgi:DNA-binding NarL/FixJ family response regulator